MNQSLLSNMVYYSAHGAGCRSENKKRVRNYSMKVNFIARWVSRELTSYRGHGANNILARATLKEPVNSIAEWVSRGSKTLWRESPGYSVTSNLAARPMKFTSLTCAVTASYSLSKDWRMTVKSARRFTLRRKR